jgi:hypothetical protein
MNLLAPKRIQRRQVQLMDSIGSPLAPITVDAFVYKDWAAHQQVRGPLGRFNLTLLPIGLCLPVCWATFPNRRAALLAMVDVADLRNGWHRTTQADLTPELELRLKAIAARHGAVPGAPPGLATEVGVNLLGVRVGAFNGYGSVQCR